MSELIWNRDRNVICRQIADKFIPVKVVLKTKNERHFLRKWIEHHHNIVGADGLIIFDNMSDDPAVTSYLDSISENVAIYKFSNMHNAIHHSGNDFCEFYNALKMSCKYYVFLDTDEYLFWACKDGTYYEDAEVASRIIQSRQTVIPGIWAQNATGHDRRFRLSFRKNRLLSGIKTGKPVMSSTIDLDGFQNHNSQLPSWVWEGCSTGNVIVGHLSNLSAEQRIAANIEKLRSYNRATNVLGKAGITNEVITLEDILTVDRTRLSRNAGSYVDEIRQLVAGTRQWPDVPEVDFLDGRMMFQNDREQSEILAFLADPTTTIAASLASERDTPDGREPVV